LDDAIVEAFEPGRQQRELLLARKLLDDLLAELSSLRGERDDPVRRRPAVDSVERSGDDVDPQDHAGTAAVRLVIDLPCAERRVVAIREQSQVELGAEDGGDWTLLGEPGVGMRNEGEDVELQRATRDPRSRERQGYARLRGRCRVHRQL